MREPERPRQPRLICGQASIKRSLLWLPDLPFHVLYNAAGPSSGMAGTTPLHALARERAGKCERDPPRMCVPTINWPIGIDPSTKIGQKSLGLVQVDHSSDQTFCLFQRQVPVPTFIDRMLNSRQVCAVSADEMNASH